MNLRENIYGKTSEMVSTDGTGNNGTKAKIGTTAITDIDVGYYVIESRQAQHRRQQSLQPQDAEDPEHPGRVRRRPAGRRRQRLRRAAGLLALRHQRRLLLRPRHLHVLTDAAGARPVDGAPPTAEDIPCGARQPAGAVRIWADRHLKGPWSWRSRQRRPPDLWRPRSTRPRACSRRTLPARRARAEAILRVAANHPPALLILASARRRLGDATGARSILASLAAGLSAGGPDPVRARDGARRSGRGRGLRRGIA